ncbi:MAG: hypothetical protein OHK93_002346 [Ramalina farinacea]|uniref:Ino eighty subunit 1 n=1 Tax=Ramalina farinacea TaxID=258253 RepID=A0AA43QSY9_9LECA|nr:hypothetical protein [Ramalina farinacea]
MRAQLRTFHAIPSLQANQDPNAYKQLQDAPRLKSILKGASEDMNQPNTIDKIKAAPVPRTNPVHLIFVLSQYAPKISEMHFQPPRDFFDLVMRGTLSSKSRARAFLWLIWWYLESNFTKEDALNNPFGSGSEGEGTDGLPIKVPPFEHLTEAQADAENVDTEAEKQYGELKRIERRKILEEDESVGPPMKKQKRGLSYRLRQHIWSVLTKALAGQDEAVIAISDTDPTRTPSPSSAVQSRPHLNPTAHSFASSSNVNENGYSHPRYHNIASKTDPSNPQKLVLKTRMDNPVSSSPPLPHSSGHPILSAVSNGHRRPRPETSHQRAVNMNRKMRIDHILHKHLTSHQAAMRRDQRRNRSSFGMMVMNRVKDLPENYDSDEDTSWGPGGLVPNRNEPEDYGAEAVRYKKVLDRALRRLARAENDGPATGLTKGYRRRRKRSMEREDVQEGFDRYEARKGGNDRAGGQKTKGREGQADEDQLDELDLDLLGENMEDEDDSASNGEGDDAELTEEDAGMQY